MVDNAIYPILWLIKTKNNFSTSKTHGEIGFLLQNMTLLWSSFLIGRAISDSQLCFRMWDLSSIYLLSQTIRFHNVLFFRYLPSKTMKTPFIMTGTPLRRRLFADINKLHLNDIQWPPIQGTFDFEWLQNIQWLLHEINQL